MWETILQELIAAIPSIIIALIASGGFWAYVEKRYNTRRKHRSAQLDEMAKDMKTMTESFVSVGKAVDNLEGQLSELYANQMQCATKLDKIEEIEQKFGDLSILIQKVQAGSELSTAYARDRLNHLSNIYLKMGYIPQDEVIPYKLLGEAYIGAGGNTETRTKYQHCINTLPTVDRPRKVVVSNSENIHSVQ